MIWCSSQFKNQTTEELVDLYGSADPLLNFLLRADIRDEVYARFSERMLQLGMHGFMVYVEEQWRKRTAHRRSVKTIRFGITGE